MTKNAYACTISGACDNTVRVWDKSDFSRGREGWMRDGDTSQVVIHEKVEELGPVLCLQFEQQRLVTGSHNCSVVVWDFGDDDEEAEKQEDNEEADDIEEATEANCEAVDLSPQAAVGSKRKRRDDAEE